jgi:N-acylglucosamine-6-phosphate 2-epimerase
VKLPAGLRGRLIVSAQAWDGSAIDDPQVLAAIADAAVANGAAAVRMQGAANIAAARKRVNAPIIGLIKRRNGFEPYITPTLDEVRAVAAAGADIVAFDATARLRPNGCSIEAIVDEIDALGRIAMADCASAGDALFAVSLGVPIVATTLCGYTAETTGMTLPALDLVREFAELDVFTICEGGVHSPAQLADAFGAGADAVVVGTAITNIDWLVREFAKRAPNTGTREG